MSILGATLPPGDHRNHNATRPKEKPSFLLGFPADSVDAEVEGNLGPEKGRCLLEGARPNHPWTARGTKATQARGQGIPEIRSLVGPAALRLAGSGPARRNPVSPAPVSWPGSVGSFLLDPVSKSSFTEQPDRVCPGPVAHCRSPQSAGPVKVPCISPPAHPRPVNAFLPRSSHSLFSQPSLF